MLRRMCLVKHSLQAAETAIGRIIQCGMSLKGWLVSNAGRAWMGKLFPKRDEPELDGAKKGAMLRVNEYHHAEHRATDAGPNTGVCGGQSNDRLFGAKAGSCL